VTAVTRASISSRAGPGGDGGRAMTATEDRFDLGVQFRVVIDDRGTVEGTDAADADYPDGGISLVLARDGFQEQPDVPGVVRRAAALGLEADVDLADVTYFLSKMEIVQTDAAGMAPWCKRFFLAAAPPATTRSTTSSFHGLAW
jgi:K+ transporter